MCMFLQPTAKIPSRIACFKTCRAGRYPFLAPRLESHTPRQRPSPTGQPANVHAAGLHRVCYLNTTKQLEMVVSISFPAPRMRASDWKSDLPVGDITGRMGFQRVATSTSTAQSMHGSLREDSPKDATDKRRGAAEELERRDLAGSVIPCFPS